MIGIIDYGVGNVQALANIYSRLNIASKRVTNVEDINNVDGLILPGVGHFDRAMNLFNESGLREAVETSIFEICMPILGICVGMQMMANSSEEGEMEGLSWIPGQVTRFERDIQENPLPLPHMGWNSIRITQENELLNNINEDEKNFYFLHSYHYSTMNPLHIVAECQYGMNFTAVVSNKNIHGVQFHPEKSHSSGYNLLSNFARLCRC